MNSLQWDDLLRVVGAMKLGYVTAERGTSPRDERGPLHLPYDARNADLLFEVVSPRYWEKPLVLTTNLAFGDWAQAFPNAACATALIERVVHHAEVITIEGKSYRRRAAEEHAKKPRPKK